MKKFILHKKGYSLMEVMVAIGVFALLAVLVTQSLVVTLKTTKKSDSQNRVRANLDYAVSVMERQIRNANSIDTTISCNDTYPEKIIYTDKLGDTTSFELITAGDYGYIASGSAQLTSSDVDISSCLFSCEVKAGVPDSVNISLTAVDRKTQGVESDQTTVHSRIILRTY